MAKSNARELTYGTRMAHWSNKARVEFSTIADRLHILTSTELRKGGGASHKHTYFLVCDTGNLLFHGPGRPSFSRSTVNSSMIMEESPSR